MAPATPLIFVVLLVGVQGVAEFLVSGLLGGLVSRAVQRYLTGKIKHNKDKTRGRPAGACPFLHLRARKCIVLGHRGDAP